MESNRNQYLRSIAVGAFVFASWWLQPSLGSFGPSAERALYFKLPIEGEQFHWRFQDAEALLAGELTLRVINGDRDDTLVVFRDGTIHDGWHMIGEPRPDSAFYFGFATDDRVRTSRSDSLIITLTASEDLRGQGPFREGVLRSGTWEATGTYHSMYGGRWNPMDVFVLSGRPPIAYLTCWDTVWPVEVTKPQGWMGAAPSDHGRRSWYRRLSPERGVDGRRCGSHI